MTSVLFPVTAALVTTPLPPGWLPLKSVRKTREPARHVQRDCFVVAVRLNLRLVAARAASTVPLLLRVAVLEARAAVWSVHLATNVPAGPPSRSLVPVPWVRAFHFQQTASLAVRSVMLVVQASLVAEIVRCPSRACAVRVIILMPVDRVLVMGAPLRARIALQVSTVKDSMTSFRSSVIVVQDMPLVLQVSHRLSIAMIPKAPVCSVIRLDTFVPAGALKLRRARVVLAGTVPASIPQLVLGRAGRALRVREASNVVVALRSQWPVPARLDILRPWLAILWPVREQRMPALLAVLGTFALGAQLCLRLARVLQVCPFFFVCVYVCVCVCVECAACRSFFFEYNIYRYTIICA